MPVNWFSEYHTFTVMRCKAVLLLSVLVDEAVPLL